MIVKCPRCRKETEFAPTNSFRPFCSERCQMLDLGAWADEQYRVPVDKSDPRGVNENTDDGGEDVDPKPPKHRLN